MGVNDAKQSAKESRKSNRAEKRKLRDRSGASGNVADWAGVSGDLVVTLAATLAQDGGAIRLGYTRDGGAYAIGIYGDGEPYTVYVPPSDDIEGWFRDAIEDFRSG